MNLILALILIIHSPSEKTIQELRKHYALVGQGEVYVNQILSLSKNAKEATVLAYAAGAEMASAQYKFSPFGKLTAFNSGKAKLEPLVNANAENVEIRFIRYSIQLKCPAILGYNKSLSGDRQFIIGQLPGVRKNDPGLYSYILSFLMTQAPLSAEEKKVIGA